jgi:uncharacterized DUF497 family protein
MAFIMLTAITFSQKKVKEHLELFNLFGEVPQSMSNADLLKNRTDGVNIPVKYHKLLKHTGNARAVAIGKVESGKYMILLYMEVDTDGVVTVNSRSLDKKTGEVYMSSSYLTLAGKNSRFVFEGSFKRSGKDLISIYYKKIEAGEVEETEKQYKFDKYLVFDKEL